MKTTQGQLADGSIATGEVRPLSPKLVQPRGPGVNPVRIKSSSQMRSTDVAPTPMNWEGEARVADSITNATNMLVESAVRYQDRVDQLEADEAVLEYRKRTREAFYGREDENGRLVDGYALLKNKQALDSYSAYNSTVDQYANDTLKGRSESVKAKMLLSIKRENEAARDRGINHNYSQLQSHEENIRRQGNLDLLADIEKNGTSPWGNGAVQAHLAKVKDVGQRQADEEYLAKNTLFMTYNDARELSASDVFNHNPARSAYEQTSKAFEKIRGLLSEETENALQNWLQGKQDEAVRDDAQQKTLYAKRELNELVRVAPEVFADSYKGDGNPLVFGAMISDLRTKMEGTAGAPDKIIDMVKESLDNFASLEGGVTLANKRDAGIKAFNFIVNSGADLTTGELVALRNYAMFELPDKIGDRMMKMDNQTISARDRMIAGAIANGTVRDLKLETVPPANMTPDGIVKFEKQRDVLANAQKGVMSKWRGSEVQDYLKVFDAKLVVGELTQADVNKLREATIDNLVPPGTLAKYEDAFMKQESLNGKKMPWQNNFDYQGVMAAIKESSRQLSGLPKPVAPSGSKRDAKWLAWEKENAEFERVSTLKMAEAKVALEVAARDAFIAKKPFDANVWWASYMKNTVNGGKSVNSSFWKQVKFDTLGGNVTDIPTGMVE